MQLEPESLFITVFKELSRKMKCFAYMQSPLSYDPASPLPHPDLTLSQEHIGVKPVQFEYWGLFSLVLQGSPLTFQYLELMTMCKGSRLPPLGDSSLFL